MYLNLLRGVMKRGGTPETLVPSNQAARTAEITELGWELWDRSPQSSCFKAGVEEQW